MPLPILLFISTDKVEAFSLKRQLAHDCHFLSATTADEAISSCHTTSISVILFDDSLFSLPLCTSLHQALPDSALFLITSRLKREFAEEAKRAGIRELLPSPPVADEIRHHCL